MISDESEPIPFDGGRQHRRSGERRLGYGRIAQGE